MTIGTENILTIFKVLFPVFFFLIHFKIWISNCEGGRVEVLVLEPCLSTEIKFLEASVPCSL